MKKWFLIAASILAVSGCGSNATSNASQSNTNAPATPVNAPVGEVAALSPAPQNRQDIEKKLITNGFEKLKKGDAVTAIKEFDEAIKLNPKDPGGYMVLGQTYMRLKNYQGAIDAFSAASRVAPDQAEIYYLLAVNHGINGDKQAAMQNAEKSIELFKQHKDEQGIKKAIVLWQGLSQGNEKIPTP